MVAGSKERKRLATGMRRLIRDSSTYRNGNRICTKPFRSVGGVGNDVHEASQRGRWIPLRSKSP